MLSDQQYLHTFDIKDYLGRLTIQSEEPQINKIFLLKYIILFKQVSRISWCQ